MTAARVLVILHISGALLRSCPGGTRSVSATLASGCCSETRCSLLLNFFALGERPVLVSSTGDDGLMGGSGEIEMGVDPFSSAPMTNCPADRFASASE